MTQINKITMEGFKSFQRKTAVPFYPGLTAIVGTNGSGKSNVQEAVQFVMGRRSSNLRADKMEQLIFNGGENGTPAEAAEVTLYLDNADGTFDELLEDDAEDVDEIKIGRKIKRNGYSTYRFMGTNCKRRKIDKVLDLANLDGDGYHVVRQGKVTGIVKQTPVERRKAIDRVSGIAAYDEKKDNALEELEEVEDSLQQLELKLELKNDQLEQLEREKADAEKQKELEENKDVLQAAILTKRENEIKNQLDNLSDEGEEEIDELEKEVEELDEQIEELEDRLEVIDEEMEESRDQSIMREIESIKGKIQQRKNDIENNKERIKDIEEVMKDYQNMQRTRSGAGKAVNAVMKMNKSGVYGTVADLIHYNDRFAVAVETAASGRLTNIVVDTQQTATECINHLKSTGKGRATFLPMDKINARNKSRDAKKAVKQPGVIDFAINLVDYDREYETAIKHAFSDTLVAEDLESLKKAGRVRAVTLDGDIMKRSGAMTGGTKKRKRRSKSKASSFNPEKKKAKKDQLEQENEQLEQEIEDLQALLAEKKQEDEEASEVSEELKEERTQIREEMQEIKEERKEKAEKLNNLRNTIGRDRKKRAKFEAELDNIERDWNELGEIDEDRIEEHLDSTLKSLKTKRTKTINKMQDLGNVNMRAIDEYDAFREEYDEFKEKVDQIKQEKREIEQIIEDIEEQKKEQFMEALNQINQDFNRLFQTLFQGGEASLELEEDGNIDSGLVIRAQPPNKDPHMIDSLSGGEKTLTAIAFVFALQEYQPSPFYIMDEIDAALDDKNAKRLANLLNEYADDGQCIVISHRNETVRHADRAYGVSMREGVSKVRSVDLEQENN